MRHLAAKIKRKRSPLDIGAAAGVRGDRPHGGFLLFPFPAIYLFRRRSGLLGVIDTTIDHLFVLFLQTDFDLVSVYIALQNFTACHTIISPNHLFQSFYSLSQKFRALLESTT